MMHAIEGLRHKTMVSRFKAPFLSMMAAAILGGCLKAGATPITYTLTGVFSGSLGATSFTDAAAVLTMTADTNTVTTTDNAFFYNTAGVSTFQLGSAVPVLFLSRTFGVESEYGAATFLDSAANFAVGEYNELTPYDVLSASSNTTGMFVSYGANPVLTSAGNLILTGATGDVRFQTSASGMTPPAALTPEPSSLLLAMTGLSGAAMHLRRRRHTL